MNFVVIAVRSPKENENILPTLADKNQNSTQKVILSAIVAWPPTLRTTNKTLARRLEMQAVGAPPRYAT